MRLSQLVEAARGRDDIPIRLSISSVCGDELLSDDVGVYDVEFHGELWDKRLTLVPAQHLVVVAVDRAAPRATAAYCDTPAACEAGAQ